MRALYLQARDKELGSNQHMDLETVAWIEQQPMPENVQESSPSLTTEDMLLLKKLVPQAHHFLDSNNYNSIHGVQHIMRVTVNAMLISRLLGVDEVKYVIAASIHDLRRKNDRRDIGHGQRAADWFLSHRAMYEPYGLTALDMETIDVIIRYHDIDYEDIPADALKSHKHSIDILKAADALDRFRQPDTAWWPDMRYIELKEASQLLWLCKNIVVCSERLALTGTPPDEAVLEAIQPLQR